MQVVFCIFDVFTIDISDGAFEVGHCWPAGGGSPYTLPHDMDFADLSSGQLVYLQLQPTHSNKQEYLGKVRLWRIMQVIATQHS